MILSIFKFRTLDASYKHKDFQANSSAETQFYRQLRKVARAAGGIVDAHVNGHEVENGDKMMEQLRAYAKVLGPWAQKQSAKLLDQVANKNKRAYEQKSKVMGAALRAGVAETDVGRLSVAMMAEQVALIQSIPIEAGQRAQKLALDAFYDGSRADEIAKELLRTTDVTESRALLIARTETARANASITQARAAGIGVKGYYWRTTMDGAERDSHADMNGLFVEYAKEPTLDDGTTGHAGTFPNCRCWQDVVFDVSLVPKNKIFKY